MDVSWAGLLVVALGAAMQGSFALPQKFIRGWAWEKMWLVYSITAMAALPWLLIAAAIPEAMWAYPAVEDGVLARTAVFGAGWGVGSVLFGLGIARVGIALAFAIIISLTAAVGSIVPLAVLHPEQLATRRGVLLFAGLAVVVAGVILCSRAGAMKEAATKAATSRGGFAKGLAICIASGIASPMMNFSFAFGGPIAEETRRLGAGPSAANFAVFAIAVTAGFVINAGYCLYLLVRNRSWAPGEAGRGLRNAALAMAMGALWLFGFYFYGSGAAWLGAYGPIVGWPVFMTVMVLVANFWGLATGEWRQAPARARRLLAAGIVVLIAALLVIGAAAQV
ncbi:MAG: L-rhamnose/proton symporter RhaT [Bryobacterales bacterium]|nr:L-rhamnose/proton symporter RhaT [Bryobacterales bacterium]